MKTDPCRREFLTASAGAVLGLGLGSAALGARSAETAFKTGLKKAVISDCPSEDELKRLKDAGFDGVEGGVVDSGRAEKARAAAEKLGMRIHSVLRGWAEFNSSNKAKVEETLAVSVKALEAGKAFGADAVLLVPCRIGGLKMPRPWEFLLDFDEATNRLRRVTAGDNEPFAEYIKAHNHAIDTSREAVQRLIPAAEKAGVVIALENVWNNLWVKPAHFQNFVASFKSPWVKAYFDIGNHVKYAAPEEWILSLGSLLSKCHVKDFKINPADPNGEGEFVDIRDGGVRWPVVRQALERVGYNGWMTIEGGDLSLEEHSKRLDLIVAGK